LRRPEPQLLAGCLPLVALGFLIVPGSGQAAGRWLGLPEGPRFQTITCDLNILLT